MLAACTRIEFAKTRDVHEISALSRRYIEYGLRRRYTPAVIRASLTHRAKNVVVARKDSSLVGFGIMTYLQDSANLDLLAVRKHYRQRGVGTQIVQWLEKVAGTAGIANVFAQVRKPNTGAVRFYHKLGYQTVAEVAGYYQGRESAVILCKGIGPMTGTAREAEFRLDGHLLF